jgi:uncharacterized protein YjbI with pentapeptide repeats
MIYLVIPTLLPDSQLNYSTINNYATINSVIESIDHTAIGTVLDQGKINDLIIKKFKEKYSNPNITFKRLKETEFYTISVANESDIDLAGLKTSYGIEPTLSLRYKDNVSAQVSNNEFNKILFNRRTTIENYTPWTDKDLYENERAEVEMIIQDGRNLSGLTLDDLNLSNTNYSGARFSGSEMNDANFANSKLIAAEFTDSELSNARFNNADLRFSDFSVATITGKASFVGADLKFSNFSGADLTGADLRDADFRHVNLSAATLTDCIINENTKFYGVITEDTIYDPDNFSNSNNIQYDDDIEYIRVTQEQDEDEEEEVDYTVEDELAQKGNKTIEKYDEYMKGKPNIQPPLVIDKKSKINDRYGQPYTFEDFVSLLTPKINNKKILLSEMELNKWYGISSLGNTAPYSWKQVGVNEPQIGKVFKCEAVPNPESGEAMVYETVPACMAVHELSRMLDLDNLFKTILASVGSEQFSRNYDMLTRSYPDEHEKLKLFSLILYIYITKLLSMHNADDSEESWTHIYDDTEKRKQLVKHAIFNSEEGLMNHPRFDYESRNAYPENILLLNMFIETLPIQVQVAWAQNYIKEFIEGYGQELETFDRENRSDMGFIASCLNGNLEKFLLSIRTAIVQFYPVELEEETEEQKLQTLKNAVTGSEFQKYFQTVEDIDGPTMLGYKNYIQSNADVKEELRQKYLELLEDPEIVKKIEETISIMSGGRKRKQVRGRKTMTRKTITRKIGKIGKIGKKSHNKTHKKSQKKTHKKTYKNTQKKPHKKSQKKL